MTHHDRLFKHAVCSLIKCLISFLVFSLQDQYDKVCNHAKHGIDFVDRTSNFIKDRIALELNYAKELRLEISHVTSKRSHVII